MCIDPTSFSYTNCSSQMSNSFSLFSLSYYLFISSLLQPFLLHQNNSDKQHLSLLDTSHLSLISSFNSVLLTIHFLVLSPLFPQDSFFFFFKLCLFLCLLSVFFRFFFFFVCFSFSTHSINVRIPQCPISHALQSMRTAFNLRCIVDIIFPTLDKSLIRAM